MCKRIKYYKHLIEKQLLSIKIVSNQSYIYKILFRGYSWKERQVDLLQK